MKTKDEIIDFDLKNTFRTEMFADCLEYRPEWIKSIKVLEVTNHLLYPYEVDITMVNDVVVKYYLSDKLSTSLLTYGGHYVGTLWRPVDWVDGVIAE